MRIQSGQGFRAAGTVRQMSREGEGRCSFKRSGEKMEEHGRRRCSRDRRRHGGDPECRVLELGCALAAAPDRPARGHVPGTAL